MKNRDIFHGVRYSLEDKIVRVNNDLKLEKFLKKGWSADLRLAHHLKKQYKNRFHKRLDISTTSLGVEIRGHYKLMKLVRKHPMRDPIGKRGSRWLSRHMEVIDCGEKSVDNNRFLWDMMAPAVTLTHVAKTGYKVWRVVRHFL